MFLQVRQKVLFIFVWSDAMMTLNEKRAEEAFLYGSSDKEKGDRLKLFCGSESFIYILHNLILKSSKCTLLYVLKYRTYIYYMYTLCSDFCPICWNTIEKASIVFLFWLKQRYSIYSRNHDIIYHLSGIFFQNAIHVAIFIHFSCNKASLTH